MTGELQESLRILQFARHRPSRRGAYRGVDARPSHEELLCRRAESAILPAAPRRKGLSMTALPDDALAAAVARVPAGGFDPWDLGIPYIDPAPVRVPISSTDDLLQLAEIEITSVRQLLSARPTAVCRATGLPWERVVTYRLIARWWIQGATLGARHRLASVGWSDTVISHLSGGAAHMLADMLSPGRNEPMEMIVSMANVLSHDELRELSPRARMARRQAHARETQGPLIDRLQLSDHDRVEIWLANQLIARLTLEDARRIAEDPSVRRITPALPIRACVNEGLARVAGTALLGSMTGRDQIVALIDSGVDDTHADFVAGQIVHKRDYTGRGCHDEHGHGTHLAGIIGARCSTYQGAARDATIWCYRALDHNATSSSQSTLTQAIQDVVTDAQALSPSQLIVVNCSFEVPPGDFNTDDDLEAFCDPFDHATNDLVVVVAAGNGGPEAASITAPGSAYGVLTVGASVNRPSACLNVVSPFSSRGPVGGNRQKPDVLAPGGFENPEGNAYDDVSMVSCRLAKGTLDSLTTSERPWPVDTDHFGTSGTSQATALVSGLCALLLDDARSRGRTVTHADVKHAITSTARRLGYGKYEEGHGLIKADAAKAAL
jgi:subtilisin family serine protease